MHHDEIIEEVWRNREALAKRSHHNLHNIVLDIQKRQGAPLSEIVDRRRRIGPPPLIREDQAGLPYHRAGGSEDRS